MTKDCLSGFVKGTITGMIAGAAVVTVGKMMISDNRNISKGSGKAMKAVGDFIDGVQTMFK